MNTPAITLSRRAVLFSTFRPPTLRAELPPITFPRPCPRWQPKAARPHYGSTPIAALDLPAPVER